jgi:hypothetical protein
MVIGGKHFGQYTYEHWFDNVYEKDKEILDILLRLEEENDHDTVENLTRETFRNVYKPGCDEHLLVHNMRNAEQFISELDYDAIYNEVELVGNIVYAKAKVLNMDQDNSTQECRFKNRIYSTLNTIFSGIYGIIIMAASMPPKNNLSEVLYD